MDRECREVQSSKVNICLTGKISGPWGELPVICLYSCVISKVLWMWPNTHAERHAGTAPLSCPATWGDWSWRCQIKYILCVSSDIGGHCDSPRMVANQPPIKMLYIKRDDTEEDILLVCQANPEQFQLLKITTIRMIGLKIKLKNTFGASCNHNTQKAFIENFLLWCSGASCLTTKKL